MSDQDEDSEKSFKDYLHAINISVGTHRFSGKTSETLNDGWALTLVQIQLRPITGLDGLRLGVCPLEFGGNDFKLTPKEKDTLKYYSLVTQSGGTRTVEPPTELTASFYRAMVDLQFYPLDQFLETPTSAILSPYFGGGLSFYRIWLKDAGEGLNDESHSGLVFFANAGLELRIDDGVALRAELLYGPTPDWRVRLLPELRPIEKGNYTQLKIGIGIKPPD
ncbi:MAG: hypothetical protein FJY85_16440 [Deltaproteobacteria bacterium]|nr:hypothetical protein [Deltaproteobacteria bacterium]